MPLLRSPAADGEALQGMAVACRRQWLAAPAADALLIELRSVIAWEQHYVRLFGRSVASPRRSCWIGDAGASYRYSGTRFEPRPWPQAVMPLRLALQRECAAPFNSVLANWYRDGNESMGWHADDETELGPRPLIASLSLGATRRFMMRRKSDHRDRRELWLAHGDLLLMRDDSQQVWQHALPKAPGSAGDRINLTFRQIHPQ